MKNSDRWLLFQQLSFVRKHVTLSQKIRLALPASIPESCFFDQEAVPNENSKGDIRGFPNWDWKISKQPLSISEHCKNTTHHTKWLCLLQCFSSLLRFWPYWCQLSCFALRSCRLCGAVVRRNTKRLQVPCRKLAVANRHGQVLGGKKKSGELLCLLNRVLDTFRKVEVWTPCLKRKRTREDAIPKRHMTFFNPDFPRQSMNCSGQDNRGYYKDRLPEKCRTVEFV